MRSGGEEADVFSFDEGETDVLPFDEEGETDVLSFVCFFVEFVTGLEVKGSFGSSEV